MTILLSAFLLALHLTAVALAAVGPVVVVALRIRSVFRDDDFVDCALYRVAVWATLAAVVGGLFGFAAGGWRAWTGGGAGEYVAMLYRFPPRAYYMLAIEWAFTLVCYVACLALWQRWRGKIWLLAVLAVAGATNLSYHFAPWMIAQDLLASQPGVIDSPQISRAILLPLLRSPYVLAKACHVVAAGLVIASAALLVAASRGGDRPSVRQFIRWAASVGLLGTAIQMLSGMAVLLLLPAASAQTLTGATFAATGLLLLGVLLTIGVMLQLARLAIRPEPPWRVGGVVAMVGFIMLTMSVAAKL